MEENRQKHAMTGSIPKSKEPRFKKQGINKIKAPSHNIPPRHTGRNILRGSHRQAGSGFMKNMQLKTAVQGAVMVVGGGIAGMQAALDLANSGYYVYMVEKSPAIGGAMAQLDKTFPTNDCSM